jgi:hypothetical protein
LLNVFQFRKAGQLYGGKDSLPVYEWTSTIKSPVETMGALLKPVENSMACTTVPSNISHNVSFLVNTVSLKSQNDWERFKSDDMGSWKNNGVQYYHMVMREGALFPVDEITAETDDRVHVLKRIYYKNKSSPDLRKIVSFLEGMITK